MYEKSRLQGGTKSVDVEDGRKELGMRSLNSLEDPTKKGGLVMLFTLEGRVSHPPSVVMLFTLLLGGRVSLAGCGDAIHSSLDG